MYSNKKREVRVLFPYFIRFSLAEVLIFSIFLIQIILQSFYLLFFLFLIHKIVQREQIIDSILYFKGRNFRGQKLLRVIKNGEFFTNTFTFLLAIFFDFWWFLAIYGNFLRFLAIFYDLEFPKHKLSPKRPILCQITKFHSIWKIFTY